MLLSVKQFDFRGRFSESYTDFGSTGNAKINIRVNIGAHYTFELIFSAFFVIPWSFMRSLCAMCLQCVHLKGPIVCLDLYSWRSNKSSTFQRQVVVVKLVLEFHWNIWSSSWTNFRGSSIQTVGQQVKWQCNVSLSFVFVIEFLMGEYHLIPLCCQADG